MSGYNYDFVGDVPDRLLCQICQLPCRDPYRSVCCGSVFCKAELNVDTRDDQLKECPVCPSREQKSTVYKDKALQREIYHEISIYCPNKKEGCSWVGEIARVDNHLKECEISCSKCKQLVRFSTIKSHLDTECPCYCTYCDITAEREVISSEHKEKCHKFPITCPNNCGLGDIPRDCMGEHKKVCPLEMVQCEYGCGAVMARNKVMEHDRERILTHIHIFKGDLDRSIQTTNLADCCTEAQRNVTYLLSCVTEKLDAIEVEKLKPIDYADSSTPRLETVKIHNQLFTVSIANQKLFMTKPFLFTMKWLLCLNWLLMQLLVLLNVKNIYWKYKTDSFVDPVLTEMDERLSLTLTNLVVGCGFKQHPPTDTDMEYQLDYWRSSMGIYIVAPVYLEMPDFDKHTITNTEWYSSPFFAYEGGYVLCLRVHANTNGGRGTRVSVYLHLMKGPYDDRLKWPLRGKFFIQLINTTTETCNPYHKTVHFDTPFDYNRITAGKMSYYGLGYDEFVDFSRISSSVETLSNLTVVDSFLTKHNSLFFMISYLYNK